MDITEVIHEALWPKGILKVFGVEQSIVRVPCDSQRAIYLVKYFVFQDRSKIYIDVKYHFIREIIEKGKVKIDKVFTGHNAADMLTIIKINLKYKKLMKFKKIRNEIE